MIILFFTYGPIKILITASNKGITNIDFIDDIFPLESTTNEQEKILLQAHKELEDYFNGQLTHFSVPIDFQIGTPFQQQVWQALQIIPYGSVTHYQEVAQMIGSPKAQQAVGQANRNNPIPIMIPCHRVIGKNGKLTGYSGNSEQGLIIKQFLLDLEQKNKSLW